ncbi:hypothetical protein L218DRAFT_1077768 [Marasmius fiardii PR-910]|nr:hypothetical protein L218DRAFT_1077768 [Marasmius fiardii PR-910]
MYRPKRKVDVSVADVVLDAIKQGAHKKVEGVDTEEPKTIPLPVPVLASSSESNHPETSIADIVLNTKTYSALHEASHGQIHPSSSPRPADTRGHSVGRVTHTHQSESTISGRPTVRTSPPSKSRSVSLDISTGLVPPEKNLKTGHKAGFLHMVRVSSKEFFSKLHKSFYPWRKQPEL